MPEVHALQYVGMLLWMATFDGRGEDQDLPIVETFSNVQGILWWRPELPAAAASGATSSTSCGVPPRMSTRLAMAMMSKTALLEDLLSREVRAEDLVGMSHAELLSFALALRESAEAQPRRACDEVEEETDDDDDDGFPEPE